VERRFQQGEPEISPIHVGNLGKSLKIPGIDQYLAVRARTARRLAVQPRLQLSAIEATAVDVASSADRPASLRRFSGLQV
jgi:hypothetical protein